MSEGRFSEAELREQLLASSLQTLDWGQVLAAATPPGVSAPTSAPTNAPAKPPPLVDVVSLIDGQAYTTARLGPQGHLEFVQFSSTVAEEDFDSLPPMDVVSLLERLSEMESWMLHQAPDPAHQHADGSRGYTRLRKEKGPDPTQCCQVLSFHPEEPTSLLRRRLEEEAAGSSRTERLETRNPAELTLGEFRGGVVAVIPEDAAELEIVLYFRPDARGRLHQLSGNRRWGLAQALREITGALRLQLALDGLEERYCWTLEGDDRGSTSVRIEVPAFHAPWQELMESLKSHLGIE